MRRKRNYDAVEFGDESVDDASLEDEDSARVPHGAQILLDLVSLWINTQRIVCTDSYFASVTAVELLFENDLNFIGVVKTVTRKFRMENSAAQELDNMG